MAKFRKKATTVEAVQWFPGIKHVGVCTGPCPINDYLDIPSHPHLHMIDVHQSVYLEAGDWIISEPADGKHFYLCKPDVFSVTYEPFEDEIENGVKFKEEE